MPKRPRKDDEDEERGPTRTCLVTREPKPKDALIRFVLSPDGEVTADIRAKLPGRGVWVSAARDLVTQAARKGGFARGFRGPARVPVDLAAAVDTLLHDDALGMLGLANKAGVVVTGFGKVESEIAGGTAAIVIHAADAAADGVRKLDGAERRAGCRPAQVNLFESGRLGLALGRPHVIHAALKPGAAGEAFLARCRRLQAFRGNETVGRSGQGPGSGTDE